MAASDAAGLRWYEVVTAIVALWGAGLSTYQYIAGKKEQRRQVKVTIFSTLATITASGQPHFALYATAVNTGRRPVSLHSPMLEMGDPPHVYIDVYHRNPKVAFPYEVTEGRECAVRVQTEPLAAGLEQDGVAGGVELVAVFTDATGGRYRSEPMKVDAGMLRQLAEV
jgi:hypothetical protein